MRRRSPIGCLLLPLLVAVVPLRSLQGQEPGSELPSVVLLDPSLSVFAGTTTLRAAADGLYALEGAYVPVRFGDEDGVASKVGGIGFRLARLALLDEPLAVLHTIARHELAGHGGRIRQLGGDVLGYEIGLPPPYGDGGGAVRFAFEDPAPLELAAVTAAGLESALVDARGLEERWVARGRMDVREGLRYLHDLLEVVGYIQDAGGVGVEEGHDVENYIALVNGAATSGVPGDAVTAGGLEDAASLELLNPTVYWALYGVLGRYLVGGERDAPIPALEIGGLRMMPTIHVRLAPFGREYAAGVAAAWEGRVLRAGVRIGDGPWGRFDGVELEGRRLHAGPRLTLGARAGLWRQFELPAPSPETGVGGMAVVRATVSVRALPVSPVVELGGKTEGYVPGEDLAGGVIARVGGAFTF